MPIIMTTTVNENSSCKLEFVVKDYSGTPIPVSSISSMVMSLYDKRTGSIINSRTAVNVKSYVDGSGQLSMILTGADNAIVDKRHNRNKIEFEMHLAVFTIAATVNVEAIALSESITIMVKNIMYVGG
jgi:hypothetical protein